MEVPRPPAVVAWTLSMTNWAQAESSALHTEDTKELHKYPIATCWDVILSSFKGEADAETGTSASPAAEPKINSPSPGAPALPSLQTCSP